MIVAALGLIAVGVLLSGFFAGAETGFYRVTRIRLLLDAMAGEPVARGLLAVANRPTLFVATALVGTNLANYLISLATVVVAHAWTPGHSFWIEILAPLVMAPLLFVYGELLPKYLFLHAPYRMLRKGGLLFLFCTLLFLPLSLLLGGLNWLIARLVRESPERIHLALARRELQRVLEEGHEVGILRAAQHRLAHNTFALAERSLSECMLPLADVVRARSDMRKDDVLKVGARAGLGAIPLEDPGDPRRLVGYVLVAELALAQGDELAPVRPLIEIPIQRSHLEALMEMQTSRQSLARVTDGSGRTLGLLTLGRMRDPLLRPQRAYL